MPRSIARDKELARLMREEPSKIIKIVYDQEMELAFEKSIQVRQEIDIRELKEKNQKLKSLPSLCPKASDVDCQLASMYMNLWVGFHDELKQSYEGSDCGTTVEGLSEEAHVLAIKAVKRFREDILNEKAHDDTEPSSNEQQD